MKKILVVLILLACFASTAYGLTYDQANYKQHIRQSLTASQNDPIYNFIGEMEAVAAGVQLGTGDIFYLDSDISGATAGTTWATAVDTLKEAFALCDDNAGDWIYVASDHEEDITNASALVANKAGVTVYGFGEGENQPTFSFITDATAELTVSDADITFYNLRFLSNYTGGIAAAIVIDADGDGTRFIGCDFRETSSAKEMLIAISVTAAADDLVLVGNTFITETGNDTSAIVLAGASDRTVIASNHFYGEWTDYVIKASGATSLEMLIQDNVINNLDTTAGKLMAFETSSTGSLINNKCYGNGASFVLVGDSMFVDIDNVFMNTENAEARNIETMFGAFTGTAGAGQGNSIYADNVLAQIDIDAILVDTDSTIPSLIGGIATSIANISQRFAYAGTCEVNAGGAAFATCASLGGFGDDYFNTGWSLLVTLNFDSASGDPEGDLIDIINYTSDSGLFELNVAASAVITTGDGIIILRVEELNLDDNAILGSSGDVLYVDNGTSGDGSGFTMENAYATLTLALDGATESTDVIIIASGHTETITGAYAINDAGLLIKGLGEGMLRPTFTLNSSTTNANLDVSVANVTFDNLIFTTDLADMASCFDVEDGGDGLTIKNCLFMSSGTGTEFLKCIDLTTNADDVRVENCVFLQLGTDADAGIDISAGAVDNLQVVDCVFMGDYDNSCVYSNQTITNAIITGNIFRQDASAAEAFGVGDAATGIVEDNQLYANDYATMFDFGAMFSINNWGTDAIDQQAIRIPLSAATEDVTGAADGSNLERLEYLQQLTNDAIAFYDVGTGNVFYVDNSIAGSTAIDWANAVATIDDAVNLCAANAGDTIFVAPGHVENLDTTDPDFDLAGITCIGLGKGEQRPVLSFDGGTDIFTISADDIAIYNLVFLAHNPDIAKGIDITSGSENAIIEDCLFTVDTEATDEFAIAINIGPDADNVVIRNCEFFMGGGNAVEAILQDGALEYGLIEGCKIYGDYSTACIFGDSTAAGEMWTIRDNILYNGDITIGLNTEPCIELKSDTTGLILNNFVFCDETSAADAIVADDCYVTGNTYSETEGSGTSLTVGQTYIRVSSEAGVNSSLVDLFDVAGGSIEIISMFGVCTTVITGTPGVLNLEVDAGTSDYDADFTTAVQVDSVGVGDIITFDSVTGGEAVLVPTINVSAGLPVSWYCPIGMIEQATASTGTGGFTWYMTFRPLVDGVTVTVQP